MAVETEQFGPSHMLFGIEAAAREAGHLLSFVTLSRSGNDMASTLDRCGRPMCRGSSWSPR